MNEELRIWIHLGSKPLIYGWLFAFARLRLPRSERPSLWKPALAGLARFALGLLAVFPLGAVSTGLGPWAATAVVSAVRLAVWAWTTQTFFPKLPGLFVFGFSLTATGLNWIFDDALFGEHWPAADYGGLH